MNTDFLNALRQVQQNNSGSTNYGSQATPNVELYGGGEKIGQYLGNLYGAYNEARQKRGDGVVDYDTFVNKTNDFIGQMGVAEGKWTEDEYKNKSYDKNAFNSYANALMPALVGYDASDNTSLDRYKDYTDNMDEDTKAAYERLNKYQYNLPGSWAKRNEERYKDDMNIVDYVSDSVASLGDEISTTLNWYGNAPYKAGGNYDKDIKKLEDYTSSRNASTADILDNYEDYIAKARDAQKMSSGSSSGSGSSSSTSTGSGSPFSDDVSEGEYVTFSYKPGDSFGQKIVDLGLATNNGLWGADGDVNFYTRQLIDQDALDANGNVKLGQTFKLRKRK